MANNGNTTKKGAGAKPAAAKATARVVEAAGEKTYTGTELQKIVEAAVAKYAAEHPQTPQVINVKPDEMVTVLFLHPVAKSCVISLGKLGQINRAGSTLDIPKREFLQGINGVVESLLRSRKLIVTDGLTDEERERYGVLYKEGELLSVKMYQKLLDYGKEDICAIFKKLCEGHKKAVAILYATAYFEERDPRVNMETVTALNKLSKSVDKGGMFTAILGDMGRKLSE